MTVPVPVPDAGRGRGRATTVYVCELAWLPPGEVHAEVVVEVADGRLVRVTPGGAVPAGARRLPGLTLPGLANAHSHVFHRALRGRTHGERGTFWTWRKRMYALAAELDPDRLRGLATAVFAELACAGFTAVGEFHYLHQRPDGRPYDDPNAMGEALLAGAREAGVRLTLLDTCYLAGGVDEPLAGVQRRFGDGDADRWADRVDALWSRHADAHDVVVGAAVHSVRAVPPDQLPAVAGWAADRGAPIHAHVSEQPAENEACLAAYGRTPTRLLADTGVLGPRATAVHATHLTPADVAALADASTRVCLCPTTERDLADGVADVPTLRAAGIGHAFGTDSHAVVDGFEEARAAELHLRLTSGTRGYLDVPTLVDALTVSGQTSLGFPDAGRLAAGARADLVTIDLGSVRTAGGGTADAAARVVFAASAADVTDVVVDGREVVRDRQHVAGDVGRLLADAIAAVEVAP